MHERPGQKRISMERSGARRRICISDVARLAGVSVSTVSEAMNHPCRVREATRERIVDVASRLGYRPNLLASSLARRSTRSIGVVVSGRFYPFSSEAYVALELEARLHGYETFLISTEAQSESECDAIRRLLSLRVAAVIMFGIRDNPEALSLLTSSATPGVNVCHGYFGKHITSLHEDSSELARVAALHLIRLGHKSILLVHAPEKTSLSVRTERMQYLLGAEKAMRESDASDVRLSIVESSGDPTAEGFDLVRKELLKLHFSAIIASNDLVVLGALRALHLAGMSVPRDISVIALAESVWFQYLDPPVTTVAASAAEQARYALDAVEAYCSEDAEPPADMILPAGLRIRESTSAPPRLRLVASKHSPTLRAPLQHRLPELS